MRSYSFNGSFGGTLPFLNFQSISILLLSCAHCLLVKPEYESYLITQNQHSQFVFSQCVQSEVYSVCNATQCCFNSPYHIQSTRGRSSVIGMFTFITLGPKVVYCLHTVHIVHSKLSKLKFVIIYVNIPV